MYIHVCKEAQVCFSHHCCGTAGQWQPAAEECIRLAGCQLCSVNAYSLQQGRQGWFWPAHHVHVVLMIIKLIMIKVE
jgi:hypothetical protein